ncbi:MAG TPA: GNAT family N-acetyltransferase [Candidatus Limnocylindria bacterium]|jgi:ribosomal protein S18 acetylase RimI-like enzyme|nr:GNAT family N-acetyltransferase [Candidatus Limnocylindria bacterium]
MNAAVAVRRGTRDERAFVRDLGRRSASSSVSSVRDARFDDVLLSFDRLLDFVFGRHHELLIADEDGSPVGFLVLLYDLPDEVTLTAQAFVAYTAVEPFARGRGVGRALLEAAEAAAREAGLQYVSLMVTEDNDAARALYDRAGFQTERRMMTKRL